ncbi:MAG: GNAT family N-acetyltransferase [Sandaracinus sp.]
MQDRLTMASTDPTRAADERDLRALAALWHEGWRDAHGALVPPALSADRTPEHFRRRLAAALADLRVAGPIGAPRGFFLLEGAELSQLYVDRTARGTGLAAALIAEAEARLAAFGVERAWLACAVGNHRAARFYEKCGWSRTRIEPSEVTLAHGTMQIDVWIYEKHLARS